MSKNVLLISVTSIKDRSGVHLNVDDKIILPEIKSAQDIRIVPALGTKLFQRLQAGIAAGDLKEKELALLDDYITDALINFVLAALPMASSFQFYTKGMLRTSSENTELPSMSDMADLSNFYEKRAEYYRERLIRYIQVNGDDFPEYKCDSDTDIKASGSGYTMQCWLPDDDC